MNARISNRRARRQLLALTVLSGALLSQTALVQADSLEPVATAANVSSSNVKPADADMEIWVRGASLNFLLEQLAVLSDRQPDVQGEFDEPVFVEYKDVSLADILTDLSTKYSVLFDDDDGVLRAISSDSTTSVSIARTNTELSEAFQKQLLAGAGPGNSVEFREDAVRVSGHPAFVKRTARTITKTLASAEAQVNTQAGGKAGVSDLADETVTETAQKAVTVSDAGADEVLADIRDEAKPPADQATLSTPIRWVTDIPGFDTF